MEIPENLKTVDGIIAAMREEAKRLLESTGSDEGFSYMADLLEAAVKRERDLASLRAIHAVEMAEHDARRETVPVVLRETQSAVHNEPCECRTAHNAAKLREALAAAQDLLARIDFAADSDLDDMAAPVVAKIGQALAAPPRNCDVGTAEEQADRLCKFCEPHVQAAALACKNCKLKDADICELAWANMPYDAEQEGGQP